MSWNVTFLGKPENVVSALKNHSTKLADASKREYDAALPHMIGLVEQNFNNTEGNDPVVKIEASGSGYEPTAPTPTNGANCTCQVKVEPIWGAILV